MPMTTSWMLASVTQGLTPGIPHPRSPTQAASNYLRAVSGINLLIYTQHCSLEKRHFTVPTFKWYCRPWRTAHSPHAQPKNCVGYSKPWDSPLLHIACPVWCWLRNRQMVASADTLLVAENVIGRLCVASLRTVLAQLRFFNAWKIAFHPRAPYSLLLASRKPWEGCWWPCRSFLTLMGSCRSELLSF